MKFSTGISRLTEAFGLKCFSFLLVFAPLMAAQADTLFLYDNGREGSPIINMIQDARESIDVEIYMMNDLRVQDAFLRAAHGTPTRKPVKVRILIEPHPYGDSCDIFGKRMSAASNDPADDKTGTADCRNLKSFKRALEKLGGEMHPFNKELCGNGSASGGGVDQTITSCLQHGKVIVFDKTVALMSTGNFNASSFCDTKQNPAACNRDFTLVMTKKAPVNNLITVFERDWIGQPYNIKRSLPRAAFNALTVSPFSMAPIIGLIQSARTSIQITEQYLKDPTMNRALLAAAKSGVKVQVLVTSFCAFGAPEKSVKEALQLNYGAFEAAGIETRAFTSAMRIGGQPGYQHAKAIIVDADRPGAANAWVGSVNGSTQSLTRNREFGLLFNDPKPLTKLYASFRADFTDPNSETWQESLMCLKDRKSRPSDDFY
ncbi:MAG: hypothetical protein H7301_10570 [Cryobacterium sp.]|nr:hypothetical protein [Oligoflexia bacterium]